MTDQKQPDLLTCGVEVWNQWKTDTHEVSPDLEGNDHYDADLSELNLSGLDLSGMNLENVDLNNANLSKTYLVGANLADAELAGANLTDTYLAGADLSGANLVEANLSNADLRNANLNHADLGNTCLRGANLTGVHLNASDLRKAIKAGAVVDQYQTTREHHIIQKQSIGFALKRTAKEQGIILYPHSNKLLILVTTSLVMVAGGVLLLLHPVNLEQTIAGILSIFFFGGAGFIFLFLFLRQLLRHTPMLIITIEGIQYCYPSLLERIETSVMTCENITLKWKDIGAIGLIGQRRTESFAVYASAKRRRSEWPPSVVVPCNLLSISSRRLMTLIQEHYSMQIESYHIKTVDGVETRSIS